MLIRSGTMQATALSLLVPSPTHSTASVERVSCAVRLQQQSKHPKKGILLQVTFLLALAVAGRLGTASLAAHQVTPFPWVYLT